MSELSELKGRIKKRNEKFIKKLEKLFDARGLNSDDFERIVKLNEQIIKNEEIFLKVIIQKK